MSKKTNDETIDLLYMNNNKNQKKNKAKNKNVPKKQVNRKETINLDDEIIIGLTPKPTPKINPKQNKQKPQIKTKSNKKIKKTQKNIDVKRSQKRIKILKCTSIIVVFIVAIILFMLSPVFNVKEIEIQGLQKLTKEEIINLSQIKINDNTFKIRGVNVIKNIQKNTYVESVDIKRELPSGIKITIKERIPQYVIEIEEGNVYIDSQGYILEISPEELQLPKLIGYTTSLESIIDYQNTKKISDEDCKKLETINQIYKSAQNNNILEYITSIDMADLKDIKLYLEGERKIAYLGNASNTNLRILYLKKMIDEESGKEGEAFINGDINTLKPKPYFRERV